MATIGNKDIEAEARVLLRKQIQDSAWYPNLRKKERLERIEQDVDRHWHLMIADAVKRPEQHKGA